MTLIFPDHLDVLEHTLCDSTAVFWEVFVLVLCRFLRSTNQTPELETRLCSRSLLEHRWCCMVEAEKSIVNCLNVSALIYNVESTLVIRPLNTFGVIVGNGVPKG